MPLFVSSNHLAEYYNVITVVLQPNYSDDEDDPSNFQSGLFSNSQTVLILTVVVGCFGILWPKIFSPMFFGDNHSHQDVAEEAGACKYCSLYLQCDLSPIICCEEKSEE